jgi:hypothetical protein
MDLSELNFSETEEAEVVQKHFEEVCEVFQREAFAPDGDPIMCQIHNAFGTFDTVHHNCLGCNFADSTELVANFLHTWPLQTKIQFAFSTFILLTYLMVERIDTLFDIIELNKTYRLEHFKVLSEIRRWANFLKHPKAFILTHHPAFSFIGSPRNKSLADNANVRIDHNFITKYYSDEKRDKELCSELENKDKVLVILPNAIEIAKDLCQAMHDCMSVIRDNQIYRTILESKTTFHDYWVG